MAQSLKNRTIRSVLWSAVERFSNQGLFFVVGILVARKLTPGDYGLVAMLTVFLSISNVFVESGFLTALIRKIDRTESDNSTVFYCNIIVGFIATLLIFLSAQGIASFYEMPQLISITRVLSVTIFLGSFGMIQQALLSSRIDFKTQAKISLTTTVISCGASLVAAYSGLGVWTLVIQILLNSTIRTLLLWIFVKWHPTMPFSKKSFNELFGFGSKLLALRLVDSVYTNINTLIIGKAFSAMTLGNYSRANTFAQFPSSNITDIILRVTFPALSHIQNESERLAFNCRKLIRMSAFIIFPLMVGLSSISRPFIITFLTEKWSDSVVYLQIICFALMWFPINAFIINILEIKGRSDLILRLGIIHKVIGISILLITLPFGLIAMCYGQVIIAIITMIINIHYTGKIINIGFYKQIRDILPILVASLVMGIAVYLSTLLIPSIVLQFVIGIPLGVAIYLSIAIIFRFQELKYIKELISNKFNTK